MWLPYPLLRIELRWNATIVQMWTNISSGIQFVSHQRRIYGSYSAGRKLSLTALITILAVKSVKDLTSSRENNGSPFSKLVKLVRIRLKFKVRYILVCFILLTKKIRGTKVPLNVASWLQHLCPSATRTFIRGTSSRLEWLLKKHNEFVLIRQWCACPISTLGDTATTVGTTLLSFAIRADNIASCCQSLLVTNLIIF